MSTHSTDTTTTVNPRERPKGILSSVNPIIPLTGTKSVQSTPNKLNLPKKAPTIVVPKIGFDDDFDSMTSGSNNNKQTPIKSNLHSIQHQQFDNSSNQILPISSSSDFMQDQTNGDFLQKKIHRRSASQ